MRATAPSLCNCSLSLGILRLRWLVLRVGSGEDHGDVAFGNCLAFPNPDLDDNAGARRQQRDLHLHRLQNDERILLGHLVADLDLDLPYRAGDLAAYRELRHRVPLLRPGRGRRRPGYSVAAADDMRLGDAVAAGNSWT